jgi:C4-dicarboxylate-specific signal transduction histidine kinase
LQVALSHAGRLSAAGQMAAALAHELSQPLAAATNSANAARRMLARSGQAKTDTVREILDEISRQSLRAGQILRRLRDFVVRGESDMHVESINTMIEEAIAFARVGYEALGVRVQFKFDPQAQDVLANRIQIQQVLVNLIRNAFEAMESSNRRELVVTTHRLNRETIEIAVIDSGPGLPKEVVAHLFEPFVSTKHNGMGLGLSICRSIVEAHGGALRHGANPEGGTVFHFTLPSASSAGESHGP